MLQRSKMVKIIRDDKTGRIKGSAKDQPAWATEPHLRRVLLMPAVRQLGAVLRYYRDGRKAEEVMQETGYTRPALMMLLVRTRRAFGITRDVKDAQSGRRNARRRIPAKHDEFHDGFRVQQRPWNSGGGATIPCSMKRSYRISSSARRCRDIRSPLRFGFTAGHRARSPRARHQEKSCGVSAGPHSANDEQSVAANQSHAQPTQDGKRRTACLPLISTGLGLFRSASRVIVEP